MGLARIQPGMGTANAQCAVHPTRMAGWQCQACQRSLCPGCVVEVQVHPTSYLQCGGCGGAVDVLTEPGAGVSFPGALRATWRLPVGIPGLFLLSALSACAAELDTLGGTARTAALLCWSAGAWLLGVPIALATAEGGETLRSVQVGWPRFARLVLWATLLTGPAVLVPRTGLAGAALVAAAALALVPLLLRLFAGQPRPLSPVGAVRTLEALGSDGLLAVACVAGLWLFARMVAALSETPPEEVPLLWREALAGLGAFCLFLVPRILGLLLHTRGEALGYPFQARGQVPVLAGARAETTVPWTPPPPPPRPVREAIPLEETVEPLRLEGVAPTGRDDA